MAGCAYRRPDPAVSVDEPALGALLVVAGELDNAGLVEAVAARQRSEVLDGVSDVDARQADRADFVGGYALEVAYEELRQAYQLADAAALKALTSHPSTVQEPA